jgi:FtsZ-binding cell division protein ZapB
VKIVVKETELQKSATESAFQAIKLEKEDKNDEAIEAFDKAVRCLLQLIELHPNSNLSKIYRKQADAYQDRIRILKEVKSLISKNKSIIPCEVSQILGDKIVNASLNPLVSEEINCKKDSAVADEVKLLKTEVNDLKNEITDLRRLVLSLKDENEDLKTKINIVRENKYYLP